MKQIKLLEIDPTSLKKTIDQCLEFSTQHIFESKNWPSPYQLGCHSAATWVKYMSTGWNEKDTHRNIELILNETERVRFLTYSKYDHDNLDDYPDGYLTSLCSFCLYLYENHREAIKIEKS